MSRIMSGFLSLFPFFFFLFFLAKKKKFFLDKKFIKHLNVQVHDFHQKILQAVCRAGAL